jgi:hypothetical protein
MVMVDPNEYPIVYVITAGSGGYRWSDAWSTKIVLLLMSNAGSHRQARVFVQIQQPEASANRGFLALDPSEDGAPPFPGPDLTVGSDQPW